MTRETNRRAVLGAVLGAAAAVAVRPEAMAAPLSSLSPVDRRVLDLWRRRAKLNAIVDRLLGLDDDASGERCDQAGNASSDVLGEIDKHIGASVLALAAVLMVAIHDKSDEAIAGLNHAALAAIRPQLAGAIAEDADRVLAEDVEART
jgi:hypothetical protein